MAKRPTSFNNQLLLLLTVLENLVDFVPVNNGVTQVLVLLMKTSMCGAYI